MGNKSLRSQKTGGEFCINKIDDARDAKNEMEGREGGGEEEAEREGGKDGE